MRPQLAAEAIETCLRHQRPVMLWGPPGIGKSDLVQQAADRLSRIVYDPRPAQMDPVDLRGIPHVVEGITRWAPPAFLPHSENGGGNAVLFLDELAQSPTMVQNACLQLLLSRRLGEYTLPAGVAVIAAGNRQQDRAGAGRVSTALADRFVSHIDVEVSLDDWQAWAAAHAVPAVVRAFIRFKPGLLHDFRPDDPDALRSFPTPRGWANVGHLVEDFSSHPHREALLPELVAGCVGRGAGAEFSAFDRIWTQLPSVDAVLAAPDTSPVPQSPDVLYALSGALAESVRTKGGDERHVSALLTYAARMGAEFETATIRDAWAAAPTIQNQLAVQRWVAAHRDLILGAW